MSDLIFAPFPEGENAPTPAQVKELQDALNALCADSEWRGRVIVLPPGSWRA